MTNDELIGLARALLATATDANKLIATAESCTGGLIAATFTAVPGSSSAFERGFVTYSNAAKREMLGVSKAALVEHGAVSEVVVRAMAEGAIAHSRAHVAVAVTGIAGPNGGSEEKPVGLVHFAAARRDGETLHEVRRFGDLGRLEVQRETVAAALALLARALAD